MTRPDELLTTARLRLARIRLRTLISPNGSPRHWVASLLAVALGFGIVTAWESSHSASSLTSARPDQLLSILDNIAARQHRLENEQERLAVTREQLLAGSKQAALKESRLRLNALKILAGTTSAKGPGVVITVLDPDALIPSSMFLDAVQELRDAGAEAITVNQVRVVANSWFADAPTSGLIVDGTTLRPPYRIAAIGDGRTIAVALGIPGGVVDSLTIAGANVRVATSAHLTLSARKLAR
jgi:uncharacterized protein YlxW (UPF0749 family)